MGRLRLGRRRHRRALAALRGLRRSGRRCGGSIPACAAGSTGAPRGATPRDCWTGDFQFGDWLDPAAPPDKPNQATTSGDYIATAYLSFSAGLVAKTAALLRRSGRRRATMPTSVADAAAAAWGQWGAEAMTTQAGCAVAIELGVVAGRRSPGGGGRAGGAGEPRRGRIATGFLGTPLVLPALCRGGHYEVGLPAADEPRMPRLAAPGAGRRDHHVGALGRDPARTARSWATGRKEHPART